MREETIPFYEYMCHCDILCYHELHYPQKLACENKISLELPTILMCDLSLQCSLQISGDRIG